MAGFLGLEDLTNSRGELALVVQTDKKNFSIEAVASLPDTSISSVQDAYLSASLSSVLPAFPRHKGQSEQHYKRQNPSVLEPFVSSFSEKSTQLSPYPVLRQENVKILMKKYKPVAQKVRPIILRSSLTLSYSPKYRWRSINGLTPVIPATSALPADGPLLRRAEANCQQDS